MGGANRWFVGLDSMQKICHFLEMLNKNQQKSLGDSIDDWS